jgi:amidohydrolase
MNQRRLTGRHSIPGFCCAAVLLSLSWTSAPAVAGEPKEWVEQNLADLIDLYKYFHRHPELSFHEEQTAARVARELALAGYTVTTEVGGHGLVALLRNGDGPTVMWRTDLDALPVTEATGLDYASTVETTDDAGVEVGVMHACGHDIHITNLIAAGRFMASHRERWSGTLMLIGQPAEERGAGAKAMLEDGLFRHFPRPDYALALHVDATLPTGFIGYRSGFALANVDSCDITIHGRGGHGSYPQGCIDPIVIAAQLIVDLQTIVSREISPLEPAVVTVGSIHGGTKHNIIPDSCHLQLTIRSYAPEVRTALQEAIERKARAIAAAHRAPEPDVTFSDGTPALFNDEQLVNRIVPALVGALGEEKVIPADQSMGGEDFSRYGRVGVPIFLFRLGSVDPARMDAFATRGETPPSLHSAEYYPEPQETLRVGVAATIAALLELMGR